MNTVIRDLDRRLDRANALQDTFDWHGAWKASCEASHARKQYCDWCGERFHAAAPKVRNGATETICEYCADERDLAIDYAAG